MNRTWTWVAVLGLAAIAAACWGGQPAPSHERRAMSMEAPAPARVRAVEPAPASEATPVEATTQQVEAGTPPDQTAEYTCPMHPEVLSDKPGSCAKCGMTLVPVAPRTTAGGEAAPAAVSHAMAAEGAREAPTPTPARGTSGGLVNVNTATLAELDAVNGIGMVTARKIIAYRETHGPLRSVDDLKAAGVTHCVLGKIKDKISFTGGGAPAAVSSTAGRPAAVGSHAGHASAAVGSHTAGVPAVSSGARTNINGATAVQIKTAVPRMSQATADAIVAARRSAGGKFHDWGEIDAVPGVGAVTIEKLSVAFDLK